MASERNITAVYHNVEEVGKNIKSSKKRFTWVLEIDGKVYNFVLDVSMISNKIKLTCNNAIVAATEEQPLDLFQHSMGLDGCQITVLAIPGTFELRVNNKAFTHMLTQERTNKEFIKGTTACQDIIMNEQMKQKLNMISSNGQRKTIRLKIGTMKTKKPSTNSVQSQDWSKLVSNEQSSFPNYFESQQTNFDYSKVSMKKKQSPEHQIKQYEQQIIQITPQQFCTMQQLFKTQAPTIQPDTNTKTTSNLPQTFDFNTMQLMFQTGLQNKPSVSCQTNSKNEEPTLEFTLNIQDFNTMQQMFNTINLNSTPKTETNYKFDNPNQLLSSISGESTVKQTNVIDSINLEDFSTMQQMFATNKLNIGLQDINVPFVQPSANLINHSSSSSQSSENNFSTMANLFKTMNLSGDSSILSFQGKSSTTESFELPSSLEQTTGTPKFNQDQQDDTFGRGTATFGLINQSGLSNSSNNINLLNMSDFNTMQNFFKTGVIPGVFQTKGSSEIQGSLKQNSQPSSFDTIFNQSKSSLI